MSGFVYEESFVFYQHSACLGLGATNTNLIAYSTTKRNKPTIFITLCNNDNYYVTRSFLEKNFSFLCSVFSVIVFVILSFFFWPLYCLSFELRLPIKSLVPSNFWPLYILFFHELRLLIMSLVSSNFWPLYILFFHELRLLITSLVSSNLSNFATKWI